MPRLLILLALLLAGCGGVTPAPIGSTGTNTAPPAAISTRPGTLAWSADWSTVDVGLYCWGDPIVCTTDKTFGTFPFPGQSECAEPVNPCWYADGRLHYTVGAPGPPIISTATFDGEMVSIEAVVSFTCTSREVLADAIAGPSLIWGESKYRSIYWRCAGLPDGQVQPHIYETRTEVPLGTKTYPEGSMHALRIDWYRDRAEYFVDGVLEFVETEGSIGPDTVIRDVPVHAALWLGNSHGTVGRFDVFTGSAP